VGGEASPYSAMHQFDAPSDHYSRWTFGSISVNEQGSKRDIVIIMNIRPKLILAAGLVLSLSQSLRAADEKSDFKDDKEKASYAIGMYFGNQIKRGNMDVDVETVNNAMHDVLAGKTLKLTDQQAQEAIRTYQQAEQKRVSDRNKKEGETFLAENKKKPGIKTHEVKLADGTTAEMQYKVITEGTGEIPKSNDVVSVNYKGTLPSGKEFDSSAKHGGQPSKFPVTRVGNDESRLQMGAISSGNPCLWRARLSAGHRAGRDIDFRDGTGRHRAACSAACSRPTLNERYHPRPLSRRVEERRQDRSSQT
jgi:FKBP-type peptidyl-prolyl cis-trans isomerase